MGLYTTWNISKTKRISHTAPNYKFRDLVSVLEKYTLVPQDELIKIIKMCFFLIGNKMKEGYKIVIPQFGTFFNKPMERIKAADPNLKTTLIIPPRSLPSFRASLFLRWYMSPEIWTKHRSHRVGSYFKTIDKYIKEYFLDTDYFSLTRPTYEEVKEWYDPSTEPTAKRKQHPFTKAWY